MSLIDCNHPSLRTPLIALVTVVFVLVAACGGTDEGSSVTGEIVSVVPRSITEFESLSVVDSDGKVWEFTGGAFAGFTPSHLLEHMTLAEPVKVWYVDDGEDLKVTLIEDG